jgi:hypothetical protein
MQKNHYNNKCQRTTEEEDMKIKVWYNDREYNEVGLKELRNLRPRRYMCGWSFEQLIKYIKEELHWNDIEEEDVIEIVIENEREQWIENIRRA